MDWTRIAIILNVVLWTRVCSNRAPVTKIGVILDNDGSKRADWFAFAWNYFKDKVDSDMTVEMSGSAPVVIDISNNHQLISSLCDAASNLSKLIIVDYSPSSYGSVQSYAHKLQIPTLLPGGSGSSAYNNYGFDISLLPPTIGAIVALLRFFQWNEVVYYLFDTNDGMQRLQRLYQTDFGRMKPPVIRARRISNVTDCYEVLRRIDRGPLPKKIHIILDFSTRFAYEEVLHQIVDVGMNRDGYHYVLGGLCINELDLETFVYGGVNITGFSIMDNERRENIELMERARTYNVTPLGNVTVDKALIIDTVHVLIEAIKELNRKNYNSQNKRGHVGRKCSGEEVKQFFDGLMVLNEVQNVKIYGLTGNVEFHPSGIRQNYVYHIHHLEHKKPLQKVGVYIPHGNKLVNMTLSSREPPHIENILNKTLRVTTIYEEPFVQYKKSGDTTGAPMVDQKYLEGYCIDLAVMLQAACDTPYDYYIDLVQDAKYGTWIREKGCWDGMVGELISEQSCPNSSILRPKADIAIAPLTISEVRQRAIDFTKPFMKTGISIMIKKPDKEKPGVFSFMYPLANTVWVCVLFAFTAVSIVLFFVGRWSPYEWADQDPKGGTPINNFNILNTFWFSLGALMQQGSDTFPRSYSGRIVGSAWWFFTLILISSYTANLAAFLTIEKLVPPINGADDLVAKNGEIKYGTLNTGSSKTFFEDSRDPTYKQMWAYMSAHMDEVMVGDVKAGVDKVRTGKGKYAFLLESAYNKYHNQRKPCNTMKIGSDLDSKGYGIATPQNFELRTPLNLAVLKLREAGELMKLEQKWWYSKGMCGTDKKDASTSALTLSNVSGVFHILVGGLVLSMVVALCEYLIHARMRDLREQRRSERNYRKTQGVRIVRKEPLEALKEAGYSDRENSAFTYSTATTGAASAPLVTFDSKYSHNPSPEHRPYQ